MYTEHSFKVYSKEVLSLIVADFRLIKTFLSAPWIHPGIAYTCFPNHNKTWRVGIFNAIRLNSGSWLLLFLFDLHVVDRVGPIRRRLLALNPMVGRQRKFDPTLTSGLNYLLRPLPPRFLSVPTSEAGSKQRDKRKGAAVNCPSNPSAQTYLCGRSYLASIQSNV